MSAEENKGIAGRSAGDFDIYTFQQDSSVRVGYPKGWMVNEHELGVTIVESEAADTAGIDVLLVALQPEIQTNEDLARALLDSFRQSTYPDLAVVRQQTHPQAPEVLTLDATFTANDTPYRSQAWSVVNPQTHVGVFATFYAPQTRYASFDAQQILAACLAPLFGYDLQPQAAAAAPQAAAGLAVSATLDTAPGEILFLCQQDEKNRVLRGLVPSTGQFAYKGNFEETKVVHPTRSLDGKYMILVPSSGRHLFCFDMAQEKSFLMELLETDKETHVSHPSISRDGKLVAVQIKTYQHVGSIDVHDWSSGAYDHTYTAIASWVKVVSFNLETQEQHAVYYEDPDLPDVMKEMRGLGPVFSPTEDILVYADGEKIYLCDSNSGENLRELAWPEGFSIEERSGLAFSPDGTQLAYLSGTTRGGAFEGTNVYVVVTVDVRSGASRQYNLPDTVRPLSTSIGHAGTICLDFSPDGRYVVFCGEAKEADEWWGIAEVAELSGEEKPTDLYALDLQTGLCHRLTTDGKSFDPVWKGR